MKYIKNFFKLYFNFLKKILNNSFFDKIDNFVEYAESYKRVQQNYVNTNNKLNSTAKATLVLLLAQIKEKYEWKFDEQLTETDQSVILSMFLNKGFSKNDFIDVMNNHPLIASYLIDKFVDLYQERKKENKPITFMEFQAFVQAAKFLK